MLRAQAGDEEAFALLVSRCHPAMLRHARRFLGDAEAARDAVQDGWLAIVRGLRRLEDPARFLPWALRIVARRAVDIVRGRRPATSPLGEAVAAPLAGGEDERLRAAIARLDFDHRVVVELFYLEELALSEVAEVLGLPVGTVKSRLFAARGSLRSALSEPQTRSV